MNKQTKIGLAIAAVVLVVALLIFWVMNITYYNRAVSFENTLGVERENSENILSTYSQKVREVAQVPGMYKDDLKEVVTASMSGRYGADGSKATWAWIKEHNHGLDGKLYERIQTLIESGRNDFQRSQTILLDTKRAYLDLLGGYISGYFVTRNGFPKKVDPNNIRIISTEYAQEAFKSGKETGPIKLR